MATKVKEKIICSNCFWYSIKDHICMQGRFWKLKLPSETCTRATRLNSGQEMAAKASR